MRDADTDRVPAALRRYDGLRRRPAQRVARRSWRMGRLVHAGRTTSRLRDGLVHAAGLAVR